MTLPNDKNYANGRGSAGSHAEIAVLFVTAIFPCLATWLWFGPLAGTPQNVQLFTHLVEKAIQLVLPLVWVLYCCRGNTRFSDWWPKKPLAGTMFGVIFGAVIAAATLILYAEWLRPMGSLAVGVPTILQKAHALNIDSPGKFMIWAALIALANSAMEEYYWRWFLFGRLRWYVPKWVAIGLSSAAFASHHVIVLGSFFGWQSWAMLFFSASVAVGGAVWAWLYDRSGSLLGPWLSHILIDAAIFAIGYDLIFASSASAIMK